MIWDIIYPHINVGDKMTYELNQKNFNNINERFISLTENLNHKISKIEMNVKWMFRIGIYMATTITAIAIKSIFFV